MSWKAIPGQGDEKQLKKEKEIPQNVKTTGGFLFLNFPPKVLSFLMPHRRYPVFSTHGALIIAICTAFDKENPGLGVFFCSTLSSILLRTEGEKIRELLFLLQPPPRFSIPLFLKPFIDGAWGALHPTLYKYFPIFQP